MSFKNNIFIVIFLISLNLQTVYSQKVHDFKYGKVNKEELLMKAGKIDSTASAEVIFDVAKSYFSVVGNGFFRMNYERHFKIKIYKKEGFKYANVNIPMYKSLDGMGGKDRLIFIKAVTYNIEDEKIIENKLDGKNIYYDKVYSGRDDMRFAFPAVKEGSIIECMFVIQSDFFLYLRDWDFQREIPVIYSSYNTLLPEYFNYAYNLRNYNQIQIKKIEDYKSEDFTVYIRSHRYNLHSSSKNIFWVAENIPAFEEEEYITGKHNFLTGVDYALSTIKYPDNTIYKFNSNWGEIDKDLMKSYAFGQKIIPNNYIKDLVAELIDETDNNEEKIKKIYHFVNDNVKWNSLDALERFNEKSFKLIIKDKKGNVSDINLLLISMLKAADINACPVILSTRENGFIYKYFPSITQFNYVIAKVVNGDQVWYIDATEDMLPLGLLPKRVLNGTARSICGNGHFEEIVPGGNDRSLKMFFINIDQNGSIHGEMTGNYNDYAAFNFRNEVMKEGGENKFVNEYISQHSDVSYEEYSIIDLDSIYKPVRVKSKLDVSSGIYTQKENDLIYFSPLLDQSRKENPFKLENRNYPVDFAYGISKTVIIQLDFPEGYDVIEQPENLSASLPDKGGKFIYSIVKQGSKLQILSKFEINQIVFQPHEYKALRNFYNLVISKQTERIVFKKVK